MEDERSLKRIIEALLFASSKPLSLKKISKITGFGEERVKEEIEKLKEEYKERAFGIFEVAGGYVMYTKEDYADYVKKLRGENSFRISKAMLETLAIIAYKQPITKAEIEILKGASADFTLRSLLEKGLIKVVGRKKIKGAPLLYGTTEKFLKMFGLKSLDELPRVE
ncbi:MAG: SMC-Scp complex subunit ScpB [candidate division WOR-3 bacterium]